MDRRRADLQLALALTLALAPPLCRGATSAPFDLDGLVLALLVGVFLLFVAVGRTKEAIAFAVLLGGVFAWGRWDSLGNERAAQRADEVLATQCLARAGNVQKMDFAVIPHRVFVRADPALTTPDRLNPVRLSIPAAVLAPGMHAPQGFASPRVPGAAYVDMALLHEPIDGADRRFLDGLRVTVTNAAGQVVAERIDYFRNPGWCLGNAPPASIEKFLLAVLGRPVGLDELGVAGRPAARARAARHRLGTPERPLP